MFTDLVLPILCATLVLGVPLPAVKRNPAVADVVCDSMKLMDFTEAPWILNIAPGEEGYSNVNGANGEVLSTKYCWNIIENPNPALRSEVQLFGLEFSCINYLKSYYPMKFEPAYNKTNSQGVMWNYPEHLTQVCLTLDGYDGLDFTANAYVVKPEDNNNCLNSMSIAVAGPECYQSYNHKCPIEDVAVEAMSLKVLNPDLAPPTISSDVTPGFTCQSNDKISFTDAPWIVSSAPGEQGISHVYDGGEITETKFCWDITANPNPALRSETQLFMVEFDCYEFLTSHYTMNFEPAYNSTGYSGVQWHYPNHLSQVCLTIDGYETLGKFTNGFVFGPSAIGKCTNAMRTSIGGPSCHGSTLDPLCMSLF